MTAFSCMQAGEGDVLAGREDHLLLYYASLCDGLDDFLVKQGHIRLRVWIYSGIPGGW